MKLRKIVTLTALTAMLVSPVSAFAENPATSLKDTVKAVENQAKEDVKDAKEEAKKAVEEAKEEAKKDVKEAKEEAKKDIKEAKEEVKEEAKKAVSVKVDGKELELENPAVVKANRTFIPVRKLVENSGAKIDWNDKDRTFTITKGDKVIKLTIDSVDMTVNGEAKKLEAAPFIKDNFSYLPLRVICEEILGYKVEWNQEKQEVILTSEEAKKEETKDNMEKKAEEVKENAKAATDKLSEKAKEAKDKVEEKIENAKSK